MYKKMKEGKDFDNMKEVEKTKLDHHQMSRFTAV